MPPTNWHPCFTCQQPAALQVIPRWEGHNDARPTRLLRPIPRSLNVAYVGPPSKVPKGWRADRGVRGGDGTPNQGRPDGFHHRRAPIIGADLPKIVVVVVAVAIAVVIVVASIPVEVEAPFRAPEFPWHQWYSGAGPKPGSAWALPDASPKPPHTNIVVANPANVRFMPERIPAAASH